MLHLAQVIKNLTSGERELQLLARQQSDYDWEILSSEVISCNLPETLGDRALVLINLDENQQVIEVEEAKNWIINIVKNYLNHEIMNPEWVEKEQKKVEKWRQEITAKSLDLTRRQLELETQKEQIQELEASLKKEKDELEIRWKQLEQLEAKLINEDI